MLDTIQYKARPASKLKVKKPNMIGIIHNIILWVEACCAVADGIDVIFCITSIEPPTSTGSRKDHGLLLEVRERSSHKKWLSTGIDSLTCGSHLYVCSANFANSSGVVGKTPLRAQKSPKNIGI